MKKQTIWMSAAAAVFVMAVGGLYAAEEAGQITGVVDEARLVQMAGQPVDISPWAYGWRADRAVQEKPEAYFIPRRLERMDKVYRTAFYEMAEQDRRSISYEIPELLEPLPPQPKGGLLAGLLWTGRLAGYQVKLQWPSDAAEIPSPETVEVRSFPTGFGWFGWSKDEILSGPEVSADRRTWTYKRSSTEEIPIHVHKDGRDWYRSGSATELVAVFYEGARPAVPDIHVTSPGMGVWQRIDVEMEWGFQAGTEQSDFGGRIETYVAIAGPVKPLVEDKGTTVTGGNQWQSRAMGAARRGIMVPLLYTAAGQPALDSRVTVWTKTGGFTFRISDLANGPILIPEHGIFITKVGGGQTARQFVQELTMKNLRTIRQMTREHREAASWEEVMQKVRLSTCPAGTAVPPFPPVEEPPMQVQLSDERWTGAWRAACNQLKGKHMWGGLAFEVGRVAHDMDMVGLHEEADKVYQHFLKSPGGKSDGDYTDGNGALEWATSMRHDMGYSHDGTHASTGRMLFAMADRYFLTGDKEWFQQNRQRLQAAADWIIRQRTLYMKNIPNRQDLLAAGLMPPCMLGDYALPSCEWRWYYSDNAFSLQGLQRFADALREFDADAGRKYHQEAEAFRKDISRVVEQEAALSPVRLGRDGVYHSFIPCVPYTRGEILALEYGSLQRPQCDIIIGALPLAEPFAALDAGDACINDTLTVMEEVGSSPKVTAYILPPNIASTMNVMEEITASVQAGGETGDGWFWNCYGANLPKASHNANIYLLQDDVPNFLRFWMNIYAAMTGADGKMWEWGHLGQYTNCEAPDNGTAGWFLECFRNLLVMEEGQSLWIARGTPRAWLEQGKKISVKNAPTYFGTLAYEITSDVDNGRINATIEIPNRNVPQSVNLRFRHPRQVPIQSVVVNGQPWNDFDAGKEIVRLHDVNGSVQVTGIY
ncbi:MAG: hypothetical protein BWY71_00060 [Planctomycetes bacterium ADurb.Bin412]|nr:MAG: hypothetical protein BWY71_00060 [Planctomycetes bacterium ADurb.Bin412]